jgi:hypothetical protein
MESMDIWGQLMQGFATAGTPVNLLWAFVVAHWVPPWVYCPALVRPQP